MKLTGKAIRRLIKNRTCFEYPSYWDFEPADFKDCVVLQVEEAKRLDNLIERINDDIVLSDAEIVSWMILQTKIKQAGKQDEDE